ncbi:MAG TPA: CPBP family intramembrane glutamic endopeptidase [Hyphomicrobium sp.]
MRELSPVFCALLVVEMALIYVGVPLAVAIAVHDLRLPVFIALLPVLAIVLVILLADPTFSLKRELTRGFGLATLLSILAVFAVGGGAVALYVAHVHPAWFLEFPRNRPDTFQKIILLYPLMSVMVQELVYRTFFFHRYGVLFGRAWWLAILLNGVLFGLGHIVIGTELALYGTMATGTLFAYRYAATRSFWAVFLEHTLWGALVFTVGLGRFFFAGVGILSWR